MDFFWSAVLRDLRFSVLTATKTRKIRNGAVTHLNPFQPNGRPECRSARKKTGGLLRCRRGHLTHAGLAVMA